MSISGFAFCGEPELKGGSGSYSSPGCKVSATEIIFSSYWFLMRLHIIVPSY